MFKQPEENIWRCVECGYSSRLKSDVSKHVEAKHIETAAFTCDFCSKLYPSRNSLKSHIYCRNLVKNNKFSKLQNNRALTMIYVQ